MPNVRRRQQTIETVTTLYNGKLRLERRNTNPTIHARTFLHGKTIGKSTGETTLAAATKVATDWYLDEETNKDGKRHRCVGCCDPVTRQREKLPLTLTPPSANVYPLRM